MLEVDTIARYRIEDEFSALEVDEAGHLLVLENRKTGRNYAGGRPLWRIYLQQETELDIEVGVDSGLRPRVEIKEGSIRIRHESVRLRGRDLQIAVEVVATLKDGDIHWILNLENQESGVIVRECHFPLVGNLQISENQKLIWSKNGGERIPHLRRELKQSITYYKAPDQICTALSINYPFPAATNCFTLADEEEGLYIGCQVDIPERTIHQCRHYSSDDSIEVGMVRFPNIKCGEVCMEGPFVLSPYQGSWHVAARKYRVWANGWFRPVKPPSWVRKMNGWQRIIMQHQYGEIHYRFDQMPQIYADGAECGISTLFMFGWQRGGMDNNYPDYYPDSRLGTEKEMRRGIDYFNSHNGQVILYANGRLIDRNSDYYREVGHRIVIKDINGNELPESYKFRGTGCFVHEFANRVLLPVCPSCPEWFEVLRQLADRAIEWNCHSLFLDQAGLGEYPCSDPSHPHPPLEMGLIRAKAETLRRLRDYLKSRNPEVALGIELLSDVTAQHVDYVHGLEGGCFIPSEWEKFESKVEPRGFLDWFRYIFPEVILTDREIRDDTDIERRVNHAVLKGLRTDVEIYRCRKTIRETPHYAEYLTKVNRLRQKYAELLLEGRYVDTEGIKLSNPEIEARAFVSGSKAAVVLTQSHRESISTGVCLVGGELLEYDSIGDVFVCKVSDNPFIRLSRHSLAVLVFRLKESTLKNATIC